MSEMIERCIKAGVDTGTDFAEWHPDPQQELVTAIIKAMREPTEKMVESGIDVGPDRSPIDYYQAMTDAALR